MALIAHVLAAAAASGPRAVLSGGEVRVFLPRAIVDRADVRKQIDSGLTTAFVVTARASSLANNDPMRIDVRYELWDEKYLVATHRKGSAPATATLESFDAFRLWWERTPLLVARTRDETSSRTIEVSVDMVPFSAREEADARRWLTESLSQIAAERGGETSGSSKKGSAGSILDAVMATSLHRKAIRTWKWRDVAVGTR